MNAFRQRISVFLLAAGCWCGMSPICGVAQSSSQPQSSPANSNNSPVAIAAPTNATAAASDSHTNEIYNFYLGRFQPVAKISDEAITNVVEKFKKKNMVDADIALICPTWYKQYSVKEVVLDRNKGERGSAPALISLFINEKGEIINIDETL
jgi:hypothetical protein